MVIQQGGIEYAENQMYNYRDKALGLLKKVPDSPAKSSFELLIDYSIKELNSFILAIFIFKIPFIEFNSEQIKVLDNLPGVYQFYDVDEKLLYVVKLRKLKNR